MPAVLGALAALLCVLAVQGFEIDKIKPFDRKVRKDPRKVRKETRCESSQGAVTLRGPGRAINLPRY